MPHLHDCDRGPIGTPISAWNNLQTKATSVILCVWPQSYWTYGWCWLVRKGIKAVIQVINLQVSSLVVNLRQAWTFAEKGYFLEFSSFKHLFVLGSLINGLGANYFISLRVNESISKRKFAAKRQREEGGFGKGEHRSSYFQKKSLKRIKGDCCLSMH